MSATPETGFLVVADLTGYTAYLSRSELEHAPAIAGDLVETIVGQLAPPLRLEKLEGDAAFLAAPGARVDGSHLLDSIEAAYYSFRRRLRSLEGATTCDCNACGLAPDLDLKVFAHHGAWVHRPIAGRDELAGPDVIVVHRLLKGSVAASSGGSGFAVFTASAIAAMGLDPATLGMTAATESIEHLGDVGVFVLDLEARWQAESVRRRIEVAAERALVDLEVVVPATPAVAWEHLTSPRLRPLWEGPIVVEEARAGGRRGIGTTAQCVTGRLASIEEIVDWLPFEHVAWRLDLPGVGPTTAACDLESTGDGTRLRLRWAKPRGGRVDPAESERLRADRSAALDRLTRLLSGKHGREAIA